MSGLCPFYFKILDLVHLDKVQNRSQRAILRIRCINPFRDLVDNKFQDFVDDKFRDLVDDNDDKAYHLHF